MVDDDLGASKWTMNANLDVGLEAYLSWLEDKISPAEVGLWGEEVRSALTS